MYGCLSPIIGFGLMFATFLAAVTLPEPWRYPVMAVPGLLLAVLVSSYFSFPVCPRCGETPFTRKAGWMPGGQSTAMPSRHCRKCDLDLTKYGLFDPRAKQAPHE